MENRILSEEKYQEIFNKMRKMISKYYKNVSDESIKKNLDIWEKNKKPLYELLSKDPLWNDEELCLVLKTKVNRKLKLSLVKQLINCLCHNHQIVLSIKKYRIADGIRGYFNTLDEKTFDGFVKQDDLNYLQEKFQSNVGTDLKEDEILKEFEETQFACYNNACSCIFYALTLKYRVRGGQKWSKVLNKIFKGEGLDVGKTDLFNLKTTDEITGVRDYVTKNDPNWYIDYYYNYNQLFSVLSDVLCPLEYDDTIYISINPLDYLTQSHGNGWSSCHSLRGKGCYHSATLTMMNDKTTLIAYTLPQPVESDFAMENKKSRQSLFIGTNFNSIFQNTFYPLKELNEAKVVREYLEAILASANNLPNKWVKVNNSNDVSTENYLGYEDWNSGQPFVCVHLKESSDSYEIIIGEEAYTVDDPGVIIEDENSLSSIGGVCDDCECHDNDLTYLPYYNRSVCYNCLENDYYYCEDVGQYRLYDDAVYLEDLQYYVSRESEYSYCEKCGCYYSKTTYTEEYGNLCDDCLEEAVGTQDETDH